MNVKKIILTTAAALLPLGASWAMNPDNSEGLKTQDASTQSPAISRPGEVVTDSCWLYLGGVWYYVC